MNQTLQVYFKNTLVGAKCDYSDAKLINLKFLKKWVNSIKETK